MATKTPKVQLNIIENIDVVSQDLINQNTEIIDTELGKLETNITDTNKLKTDMTQAQTDIDSLSTRVTNAATSISNLSLTKEDKANKGIASGYASLDSGGKVPITQLPSSLKEMLVVSTISDRNSITGDDLYDGIRVRVLDATGDPTVQSGWAEYCYMASTNTWEKLAEKESLDVVLNWSNLNGIPDVLTKLSVTGGKLYYDGFPVYADVRSVNFIGGDSEIIYDWNGTVIRACINCSEARADDLVFSVEVQRKTDYINKSNNWQLIGNSQLTLSAGDVYKEFSILSGLSTIQSGDVLRASTVGDDTGVTFKLLILNN